MIKPKWGFKRWFLNSLADLWGEVLENMQSPRHFIFFCFLSFFVFGFCAKIGNTIPCTSSCFISPCYVHSVRQFALAKYGKTLTFIDIQIKQTEIKSNTILSAKIYSHFHSFKTFQHVNRWKKKLPFDNCFFCKMLLRCNIDKNMEWNWKNLPPQWKSFQWRSVEMKNNSEFRWMKTFGIATIIVIEILV